MNDEKKRREEWEDAVIKTVVREYCKQKLDEEGTLFDVVVPEELDRKCLEVINNYAETKVVDVRRLLKVLIVAAVLVCLGVVSAFGLYNAVIKPKIAVKKENTHTVVNIDGAADSFEAPEIDVTLGYLPNGFELVLETKNTQIYEDKNGNRITVLYKKTTITDLSSGVTVVNTENTEIIETLFGNIPAKKIKQLNTPITLTDTYWLDTVNGYMFTFSTVGIDDKENTKIFDNIHITER